MKVQIFRLYFHESTLQLCGRATQRGYRGWHYVIVWKGGTREGGGGSAACLGSKIVHQGARVRGEVERVEQPCRAERHELGPHPSHGTLEHVAGDEGDERQHGEGVRVEAEGHEVLR